MPAMIAELRLEMRGKEELVMVKGVKEQAQTFFRKGERNFRVTCAEKIIYRQSW